MSLTSSEKKPLRRIAHHLEVVVSVGDHGLTDGVRAETERALTDHELIKVKLGSVDRDERTALGDRLAAACHAEVIQRIGRIVVLFRANPKANPRLSNLHRFAGG